MYKEYKQLNLPKLEAEILAKWQTEQTFEQSISNREGAEHFVFYEGPPSANGMPGIHHVISRTLKDLVCRYKTMQGYQVQRKGGWDTHGLPIELGVEKELGITKEDIGKKISVEDYNKKCREVVLRYKDKWDDITTKMGYWVDLKNPYVTYENNYIESVWWLLSKMYNRGYLYQSVSIQPYSPAAGTGLSSHELNQPGTYQNVKDTSATVLFLVIQNQQSSFLYNYITASNVDKLTVDQYNGSIYIAAWTTTPWTLPSNLGLTVGAKINYSLILTINPYTQQNQAIIIATELVHKYCQLELTDIKEYYEANGEVKAIYKGKTPYVTIATFAGSALQHINYQQLLSFEANSLSAINEITPNSQPFKVVLGDFVTTDSGTGIVHTSPAFGADDYKVGKANNLGILTLVDRQGKFVNGVGEYSGRFVKNYKDDPNYTDVNVDIAVQLKLNGQALKVEKYEHSYPHCWRTDKPILYYPLDAWFIKTTAVKAQMIAANKTIQWKPEVTGTGRFGNWLENVQDWNLSRSRFWGTPLPIWKTVDGDEIICIESITQLKQEMEKAFTAGVATNNPYGSNYESLDLHKPYVDNIVLLSTKRQPMYRVPDLIDVWFDSGAMPYAQHHFPFENKQLFANNYPANFIAEGVDQTRGWFYTLHAIASLVKEDIEAELKNITHQPLTNVAYKTVVSNGLVLDKNGVKMSKRLGNVVDPFLTINLYGADATRWYLVTNASPWDNLKFSWYNNGESAIRPEAHSPGIEEVQRKFFGTLYNTYQFYALYANVDKYNNNTAIQIPVAELPEMDRWILSMLNSLIAQVTNAMDNYEPTIAGRAIEEFVDSQLSNWYIRLCRRRFWKSELAPDKIGAYQTLHTCLTTLAQLIAPIAPFFSDTLYCNLTQVQDDKPISVHTSTFPKAKDALIDKELEQQMVLAQTTSSLILSLRKNAIAPDGCRGIKVRQPLQKVLIPVFNPTMQQQLSRVESLIKAEVNVKEIEYINPDNNLINKKIKPNFTLLGKKLGSKMKAVALKLSTFTQQNITQLETDEQVTLMINGEAVTILSSEVDISTDDMPGWIVASKGLLTTALDITITDTLLHEGNARELINKIQKIRKDANLNLTDRIAVEVTNIEALTQSFIQYNDYICGEILANKLLFTDNYSQGDSVEINDYKIFINVKVN